MHQKHPGRQSRVASRDAALLLLGIAAPNPARAEFGNDRAQLLLEPWAAQAALHRRRGGQRLTDEERDWIRRVAKWILKRDAWLTKHRQQASPPPITRHISPDPNNADAPLLLLGIAAPNPARA